MDWLRFTAVTSLALLCAGLIGFLYVAVWRGSFGPEEAGWVTAAFLAIREFISKMEKVVNGPAAPVPFTGDEEHDNTLDLSGAEYPTR